MAPRMTKAFVQPVKCADPVVFAVAKRRLAQCRTKFGVSGGYPCVSYMNWATNLSSARAVRPPNEMLGAMLIIRSSASSVTWSLLHHATDHGLVYDLGSQPDTPWAAEIFITEERGTSEVSEANRLGTPQDNCVEPRLTPCRGNYLPGRADTESAWPALGMVEPARRRAGIQGSFRRERDPRGG